MSDDDPIKQFLQQPHVFNDEINCVSSAAARLDMSVMLTIATTGTITTSDCNNGNITTRTLINIATGNIIATTLLFWPHRPIIGCKECALVSTPFIVHKISSSFLLDLLNFSKNIFKDENISCKMHLEKLQQTFITIININWEVADYTDQRLAIFLIFDKIDSENGRKRLNRECERF